MWYTLIKKILEGSKSTFEDLDLPDVMTPAFTL